MDQSDSKLNENFPFNVLISTLYFQDVIYHNEAYTNSSSGDGSPESEQPGSTNQNGLQKQQQDSPQKSCKSDTPLSPQRGQSFIAAVISAIKNATSKTAALKSSASAAASREKRDICGHGKFHKILNSIGSGPFSIKSFGSRIISLL